MTDKVENITCHAGNEECTHGSETQVYRLKKEK